MSITPTNTPRPPQLVPSHEDQTWRSGGTEEGRRPALGRDSGGAATWRSGGTEEGRRLALARDGGGAQEDAVNVSSVWIEPKEPNRF
jgi:hypothetical protein